ncbi:DUF4197 domain-containing protein [Crocinitomicaceae bacterium CZZ-1]|uniref:DUF4197 domain-containing protein n=1 Tax=Taishania pollutisoli TaxID=2766479 RepID=A0A8J6TXI9_9FLAO|nr:DUF4197 domain-containing protein [Taishania pollutisoli]MBC9812581.1 DUF4197 domain-containing protein [Taishania pollutisoli]MBX2949261.1 DUF4197 domain-containing protein [Crocinitomicaceae bacterium]NGF77133.1 DUF4197 domain-containing protein [Fluviicola sp. SGL-29]
MKKIVIAASVGVLMILSSCDVLESAASTVTNGSSTGKIPLSNEEVVKGLKEALSVGITNSVNLTSVTDGFLKNAEIRLPFPPDAIKVREKAIEWGLDGQVEKFETTLNRAAEEAAKEALPIFKNAITGMSLQDGFAVLNGGKGAATKFLKDNTTNELIAAFAPKVKTAIEKVKLTDYWNPIVTKYNTAAPLLGTNKVNPDLNEYVTQLAIDGLFKMVEKEENKIRDNASARVSDLLQRVFGSLDK